MSERWNSHEKIYAYMREHGEDYITVAEILRGVYVGFENLDSSERDYTRNKLSRRLTQMTKQKYLIRVPSRTGKGYMYKIYKEIII